MKLLRRYPELIVLTLLAFVTRFWNLFNPHAIVFDEVYFKAFAGDYLKGAYYFDIHPPLGKLLLGGVAWLAHLDPTGLIGSDPAVVLRLLPAFAGALIIPVFYLFLRQLRASKRTAALGAALLLLDNALLVESRFILIDSLLILFGLSAVTCFLASRHAAPGRRRYILLAAAAVLAGLSAATKWTGLTALGLIGLIWLTDHLRRWARFTWPTRINEGLIILFAPLAVYMAVFAVHFAFLTRTGPGDAFMPLRFQSTLIGNPNYDPAARESFLDKFLDLNVAMNNSEASLKNATHPYGSKWNTWPLMIRPIYYWQGETRADGTQGNIYLLGNPAVWWGILIIIAGSVLASGRALKRLRPYRFALVFLGAGYVMNFLPFSRIIRVMFLYHYFFALIYSLAFAVIMLGALADWNSDRPEAWRFSSVTSRNLYLGVLMVAVIGFVYFAPLSYGIPLSPAQLAQHMWLHTWR